MPSCSCPSLRYLLLGLSLSAGRPTEAGRPAASSLPLRPLASGQIRPSEPFNARAAWEEFTELVRTSYAYFTRPGVDGEAILTAFAPAAQAAATKADFREVLQLIAHNFADPHFLVGPLDSTDYNVVPTSADLVAHYQNGRATLVDVRAESEAAQQGIRPGAEVLRIEGLTPQAAIEQVMGRPLAGLSDPQVAAGLTIALAGRRQHTRQLTLAVGRGQHTYHLRSPGEQAQRLRAAPPLRITYRAGVTIIRFNNSLGNNATIAAFQAALQQAPAANGLILDFRNTPSGGNTTVARGIMGHFVQAEKPYQIHVVPSEQRRYGVPRKFVEYVLPLAPYYAGKVVVLGGHWTGSMGEGLLVGFAALGVPTAGSELADLLGAVFNEKLAQCDALVDLGEEQLLQVNGQPREDFIPRHYRAASEGTTTQDELLEQAVNLVQ